MVPVSIALVETEARPGEAARTRRVVRQQDLTEQLLARRPVEYPTAVEAAVAILAVADEVLPLLLPGERGVLEPQRLACLLGRYLDQAVLDTAWQHRLAERLTAQHELRLRRSLMALLRDDQDPQDARLAAEAEAAEIRAGLLDRGRLQDMLAAMVEDGLIAASPGVDGPVYHLRGAVVAPQTVHGEAVRDAILCHLAEVRGWNLPAPSTARFVELAREHSRILEATSVQANSMLRAEVRQRLGERLVTALQPAETRTEQILRLLLADLDLPRSDEGAPDPYRLAAAIEPVVVAPENVLPVLEQMVAAGELQYLARESGQYVDPELARLLSAAPPPGPEPLPASPAVVQEPPGLTAPGALDGDGIKARLRLLRELLAEELITADDYEQRKQAILAAL